MSYTFLLDAEEEFSVESFSDIPASVLLRLNLTGEKCCCNGSETEFCPSSPSGTMCEPLMENHGEEKSMSCVQGSHAKDIPLLGKFMGATNLTDGLTPYASLMNVNQNGYYWKMSQQSLGDIFGLSLDSLPDWGMTVDGECFQLVPLVHHTLEKECSVWRTPAASDNKRYNVDWPSIRKRGNPLCLPQQIAQRGYHGYLNPQFVNALMGWPITWTQLSPLAMDKFQQWLRLHGKH